MIIETVRHGRTGRDVANLVAHVEDDAEQEVRLVSIGNCPVANVDAAMEYMQAMRDGSRAKVAMHHITINPDHVLTPQERDEAVRRVLAELGADDHAYVLWEHSDKPRATADGCPQHFHLVVAHVGPSGRALDDRSSFLRLEAVARTLEVDLGESLTHSRRSEAVAKHLAKRDRADVAAAVMAIAPAELPRSSMTKGARAQAEREGIDLPKEQALLRDMWASGDSTRAKLAAAESEGFNFEPGEKPGTWIVRKNGAFIGAADRILKVKKAAFAALMEGVQHDRASDQKAPSEVPSEVPSDGPSDGPVGDYANDGLVAEGDRRRHPDRDEGHARGRAGAPAPVGTPEGGQRGGWPAGRVEGPDRGHAPVPEASPDAGGGPAQEVRRPRRGAEAIALHGLERLGSDERLRALRADLRAASYRRPRRAAEAIAVVGLAQIGKDEKLQSLRADLRAAMYRRPAKAAAAIAVVGLARIGADGGLQALRADLRAAMYRRPQRAQEAIAVAGLARLGAFATGRAELREAMKPALQRVVEALDRREEEARDRLAFGQAPVQGPPPVVAARLARDASARALGKALGETASAREKAERDMTYEQPTDWMSYVDGRQRQWKRERKAAERELERIENIIAPLRETAEAAEKEFKRVEAVWRPQIDAERKEREEAKVAAEADLKLVEAAREVLRSNPGLAQQGLDAVLDEARRRLEGGSVGGNPPGLAAPEGRRLDIEDEPTAPKFQ